MTDREILIREINELPDYLIRQLRDIIHYIKLGIDNENKESFKSISQKKIYNSSEYENIVAEVIAEYSMAKTDDMYILENEIKKE